MPNARIWKRRTELKITQVSLAKAAGIRQAEVSQIERDDWVPPVEIRERLAEALETSADELFDLKDKAAVS